MLSAPSARPVTLRARPATFAPAALGALALFAGAACGRRATPADCQLIVDKAVELQLQLDDGQRDAAEIARREREVRAALDGEIRACESRRVTNRTMACVQSASTMQELDKCLR